MKKITYLLFALLISLVFNTNVEALNTKEVYTKIIEKNKNKSNKIIAQSTDISREVAEFSKMGTISLSKIGTSYKLGTTVLDASKVIEHPVNSAGELILEYKDSKGVILKSYYKKMDATKGYAHIKNSYYEKDEDEGGSYTTTVFFKYDVKNYKQTEDLIAGQATNAFYVYKMESDIFGYIMRAVYNADSKTTDDIIRLEMYKKINGKYTLFAKLVPSYDAENKLDILRTYYYNSNLDLTSYRINKSNDQIDVDTYSTYISYYSKGKVKQRNIYNRNLKNQVNLSRKIIYRSNGKKYSYKVRTYKAGKVVKQRYYRYNTSGLLKNGAYRKTVVYNKAKAYKAYSNTYNSKGKLSKSKTIKLTKTLSKW